MAELLAVNVTMLALDAGLGLNIAMTPLGKVEVTVRLTLPVKPFVGFTVMALVLSLPWVTLRMFGDADKVKFGMGVTVRLITVVWVKVPDVPVIVTVADPVVAELLAVSVRVLGAQALHALVGLNDAVTPDGSPDAENATLPPKPFSPVTVIVVVMLPPWVTVRVAGEAEIVNPGCAVELELLPQPANASAAVRRIGRATRLRLLSIIDNSWIPHLVRPPKPLQGTWCPRTGKVLTNSLSIRLSCAPFSEGESSSS
jgi:hypothetical protein